MSKDPAFLFYPGDWLGGTMLMTRHHKGAYMDLLMAQYNNGHMTIEQIKILLGKDDENLWETVLKSKFKQDETGKYFNKKLDDEIIKRKLYTESRTKNLKKNNSDVITHKDPHMGGHMENENENINDPEFKIGERGPGREERFDVIPPSIEAVSKRMKERDITSFTAEAFCAFYQSKGWKVGKESMKNWDAALTTWVNRHNGEGSNHLDRLKYKTYDEMCQLALTNSDIWKQMLTLNLPSMPRPVWAHPNEVALHGLSQYIVKSKK